MKIFNRGGRILSRCFFSVALAACISVPAFGDGESPTLAPEHERVVVIANADDAGSLEIAEHYMKARGVPAENLVALPFPKEETVSWADFSAKVFSPLRREFSKRGWIDGRVRDDLPPDEFGRVRLELSAADMFGKKMPSAREKISYVVLCRGVPLRIANDASKLPPLPPKASPDAPTPKRGPLDVNCASADSELALLGVPESPVNGAMNNPFFKENFEKSGNAKYLFLRVARLDGISVANAKALVDSALAAEKNGLLGRAYVDVGGPHAQGDVWLKKCAEKTRELGFDTSEERSRSLMDASARYDAPALYFGWYSQNVGGFFRDANFRFPAGAVAIHIHSFSATSMRSKTAWTPGLVARGAAATVGNVYEPYLGMTHYPHLFLEALASGMTAGEAAAYSIPVLSWQGIFVGDPLYRPFLKAPEVQMNAAISGLPTKLSQYAFLRAANLAERGGNAKKAELILKNGAMFAPGLAINFYLAKKEIAEKGACTRPIPVRMAMLENPGLLLETARELSKASRASDALKIYSELLDRKLVPGFIREKVLSEACDLARSRGDSSKLAVWYPELRRMKEAQEKKGKK
ncbi:MAG: TIGR03790 family protein [Verrucomicrobia bacterium]|nr:TIGR03790 family protein [Verrucomicrobiota bacterium]